MGMRDIEVMGCDRRLCFGVVCMGDERNENIGVYETYCGVCLGFDVWIWGGEE